MADKWTSGVITNAGISMLGEVMSGGELIISRAALGGGTVDVAALMAQTALTQPLTVPVVIAQKKLIEGKGLDIRVQIRNTGVSAAQTMKQVGIFAKIGADGEEKLFAIMQDDVGDEIPSAVSYPDFMLEFTSAVAVSNTGNITVSVSGSAVVTREDLEAALDETTGEITRLLEGKADKSYVDNGLAGKAEKSDVPTKVSDLVNDSGFITSPDGGNAETLQGKSASDFAGASDLTTHKNDTTVHITAEERVKWDGKADKSDIPTKLPANGGNADTVGGYAAEDFALSAHSNASNQIQIPDNVDVPLWISGNAKLYTRYYSNTYNTGLTNIPGGDPNDWVWYYTDGFNIIATGNMSKKVWISAVINQEFRGWTQINSTDAVSVNGVSVQTNAQAIGLHQMFVGTADAASVSIPAGAWYGKHS